MPVLRRAFVQYEWRVFKKKKPLTVQKAASACSNASASSLRGNTWQFLSWRHRDVRENGDDKSRRAATTNESPALEFSSACPILVSVGCASFTFSLKFRKAVYADPASAAACIEKRLIGTRPKFPPIRLLIVL